MVIDPLLLTLYDMSYFPRKHIFRVSDQVRHHQNRVVQPQKIWLEASNCGFKTRDCSICAAKTKVLNSGLVTMQLICAFVFTYAKCRFSHDVAHTSPVVRNLLFANAKTKGVDRDPLRYHAGCSLPLIVIRM